MRKFSENTFTPTSIEVWKTRLTLDFRMISSPTRTGLRKIYVIYRRGYYVAVGMAMRGDGAGDVDKMQDAAAEDEAERIRVVRKHGFHHFRPRGADGPALNLVGRDVGRRFVAGLASRICRFLRHFSPCSKIRLLGHCLARDAALDIIRAEQ